MKKQLFIMAALMTTFVAFSQSRKNANVRTVNMVEKYAHRFNHADSPADTEKPPLYGPVQQTASQKSAAALTTWNLIGASMNVLGVLESSGKPLQYNDQLNAVSWIHRKSLYYQPAPFPTPLGAETGAIVGMVSTNWGVTWDSTCIWNNNNNWARYPQGGLYNPSGNTSLSNAYILASGPTTQANTTLGWMGNYMASKKLDVLPNPTASPVPDAQKFVSNKIPYDPAIGKIDYPSFDFAIPDNGLARSLGILVNDFNSTAPGPNGRGFRGANVLTGTFSSTTGTFDWVGDSIIPDVVTNSQTQNKAVINEPHMAWNEAGTVGYVWFVGCRTGATGNNMGFQPIVYKSVNGGTWTLQPGIDFNDVKFKAPVLDHLLAVELNTVHTIPFFNFTEGMDGTVDMHDRLHIMSTVLGTGKEHPDSLGFTFSNFPNWDGETYAYAHGPGQRPYIYDFYQTSGTNWEVAVIDSMATEAPGERPVDDGFQDNPWDIDPDNGNKVSSHARLQMSRTPDGSRIIYTWAESDTGLTNQGRKWNHVPNVRARCMVVNANSLSSICPNYYVTSQEHNLTSTGGSSNQMVKDRAQMHHTSPICAQTATTTTSASINFTITLPVTVTNNQSTPLTQKLPNQHWYAASALNYFLPIPDGVDEITRAVDAAILYPNPADRIANLKIDLVQPSQLEVTIDNLTGQRVRDFNFKGNTGENTLPLNIDNLPAGIYLVTVNVGNAASTKKLVVE